MAWLAPIFIFIGVPAAYAASVSTFVIGLGVSLTLGAVSKLFTKRNVPSTISQDIAGRNITVRQSIAPRRVIYGRVRVGGIITYLDVSPEIFLGIENGFLHMVITLSGHEINAINGMYFDGVLVPMSGIYGTGKWNGYVNAHFMLGTRDQAAIGALVTATLGRWTTDHRQRGCAYVYLRLTYNTDRFPNGLPNVTFDVEGKKVYDPRSGQIAFSDNAALCIADYLDDPSLSQGLRYEPQSQEALFPGDKGFDFVPMIQEKNITWGPRALP
jgi:hypothetical protein